ncbi:hypothetical protein [Gynuella sunshinyii]|uniref:Uncharacterized protein n=1 Tax=Gynuella sunshinyii YC6258 TaxID=1445510 RepID=A0A0C5VN56_9GAMM|nr:hypothetical protein [Gynuella sunshinyii]AJQ94758.1 hypothetical Protein YC6258_02720 [Gynuella sunshinyii YC6258]
MGIRTDIPAKIWNGIERGSYTLIAQEAMPSGEHLRRWIAIYAVYKLDKDPEQSVYLFDFLRNVLNYRYCIVDFEVPIKYIEYADGVSESQLVNVKTYMANTIEELYVRFEQQGIDASKFEPEWKCEYPL